MDKDYYLIISLALVTIIKKKNVQTSMIKNVFYFESQIKSVKNMDKVYYLIISLDLVIIIKMINVETSMIKKCFFILNTIYKL